MVHHTMKYYAAIKNEESLCNERTCKIGEKLEQTMHSM